MLAIKSHTAAQKRVRIELDRMIWRERTVMRTLFCSAAGG
jgi:hypothetical protein